MKDGKSGAVKEGGDSELESQVTVIVEGAPGVKTRAVAGAKSLKEAAVQARASSADRQKSMGSMAELIQVVAGAVFVIFFAVLLSFEFLMAAKDATRQAVDDEHEHVMGTRVGFALVAVALWTLLVGIGLSLIAGLVYVVGLATMSLMVCAGAKSQDNDGSLKSPAANNKPGPLDMATRQGFPQVLDRAGRLVLFIFAILLGLFPVGYVVWAFTGIYLALVYCAQETLGKGDEHVKGMYAVYALLTLGCVLGGLALAYIIVLFVVLGALQLCVSCGLLEQGWAELGEHAKCLPGGVADRARHSFFALAPPLFISLAGVFLAAFMVWTGTGAYLGFEYCAKEAWGRGGEHVKSMYAVYALLALGLPLAWLALAYFVVFTVSPPAAFNLPAYTDTSRRWRPKGVAERAAYCFVSLGPPLFLSTACVFLAALVVWAGTGAYFGFHYCAKEALGQGGEHVKAMYAVYALLTLGLPLAWLALAYVVTDAVAQLIADALKAYAAEKQWSKVITDVAKTASAFFLLLRVFGFLLLLVTACIFLATLVVWLGTGIYVAFSYCANDAVGQGGEHVQGIYAVYALLALSIVMGVFAVVYLVAYVVAEATIQFNRAIAPPVSKPTGEKSQPEPQGVAAKARGLFGALASTLLKSTAGVFLAALVVWAGTGIYLLVSGRAH